MAEFYDNDKKRALTETGRIEMMKMLRLTMPSMIATELASVEPMPDDCWNEGALARAYTALVSMHDREPLLPVQKLPRSS